MLSAGWKVVPTLVLAGALVACSSGSTPDAPHATGKANPTETPIANGHVGALPEEFDSQLMPVRLVSRDGPLLVVELPQGLQLSVDLRLASVFDCRTSCIEAVHSDLLPTGSADTYCFWQHGTGQKLWVNRPECPNGVRRGP